MKIFQRQMQLRPDSIAAGTGKFLEVLDYLQMNFDQEMYGWRPLSGTVGRLAASTRVDSWSAWSEKQKLILADSNYVQMVQELGSMSASPAEDVVVDVFATSAGFPTDPGQVIASSSTVVPMNKVGAAIDWSRRFVEMVNSLAGTPVLSAMNALSDGGYMIGWLLYYTDLAQYEERQTPEVWSMIGSSPLFREGLDIFDMSTNRADVISRVF